MINLNRNFIIATLAILLSTPVALAQSTDLQAQINALLAQIQVLQAQLATSQGTSTATACSFTRNLTVGSTGDDVKCLQQYLNGAGFQVSATGAGAPGSESTYFGAKTRTAVAAWQAAKGVSPAAGYFGSLSRSKYSEITVVILPPPPAEINSTEAIDQVVITDTQTTTPTETVSESIAACQTRKVPSVYNNIQAAVNAACSGDIILVAPGNYSESIIVNVDNLTLKSEAGSESTIITADRGSAVIISDGVKKITIDGFTINGNFDNPAIYLGLANQTVSWTIQNNIIKNSAIGISFRADAGVVTIKRNLILASKDIGILDNLSGGNVSIENNSVVKGNVAYHLVAATGSHVLKNNIFVEFEKNGVEISSSSTDQESQILSISYNDVWSVRSGSQGYFSNRKNTTITPSGVGNLTTDPLFLSTSDYHLRSSSPALNSGDPSSPVDPDNTRADMGVYPFASVVSE